MRNSINMEALKLALMVSVKQKVPEEGVSCPVCKDRFKKLHVINLPGMDMFMICDHCVEEFKEYFRNENDRNFETLFANYSGLRMGQYKVKNHTEFDSEDFGSYYDTAKYVSDHS